MGVIKSKYTIKIINKVAMDTVMKMLWREIEQVGEGTGR